MSIWSDHTAIERNLQGGSSVAQSLLASQSVGSPTSGVVSRVSSRHFNVENTKRVYVDQPRKEQPKPCGTQLANQKTLPRLAGCEVELLKLPLCTSLKLISHRIHSLNRISLGQDGVPAAGAEPPTVPPKPTSSTSHHQACARICQPCRNFRNRMHNSVERFDGMECRAVTRDIY